MARIILVGTAHPLRGGLATFNERLARALQDAGHEVAIWTFSLQYPNFLFPGKTQYSEDPAPADLDIEVRVNSIFPFNWWRVGEALRKEAPDLVLMKFWIPFIGPSQGTLARRARRNGKTKALCILDNVLPHEQRPGDRALIRYFVQSMDGFVAMSRSVLEDLGQFDEQKPRRFAPHPIYDTFGPIRDRAEARAELGLNPEAKYLLFFGFIRAYKGLDWLIQALADPRLQAQDVRLIVAGEFYQDAQPYHDLIASLGLEDRVILATEYIPNEAVGAYFCAADLVVQPYKTATQSGVTQIAYHFERPMVVTKVGGLPEIVPDGKVGYVVETAPPAIADAIHTFFSADRATSFAEHLKIEKQRFSWEHFVAEIEALYYEALAA